MSSFYQIWCELRHCFNQYSFPRIIFQCCWYTLTPHTRVYLYTASISNGIKLFLSMYFRYEYSWPIKKWLSSFPLMNRPVNKMINIQNNVVSIGTSTASFWCQRLSDLKTHFINHDLFCETFSAIQISCCSIVFSSTSQGKRNHYIKILFSV